jgi:hypothetical protein
VDRRKAYKEVVRRVKRFDSIYRYIAENQVKEVYKGIKIKQAITDEDVIPLWGLIQKEVDREIRWGSKFVCIFNG